MKSIGELDFFENIAFLSFFIFRDIAISQIHHRHLNKISFRYECEVKTKIPLIGTHACSSVRTQ